MTVPIYTGGRLQAEVQIATAAQQQAVALYGAAALRAFAEVENSLATENTLSTRLVRENPALADRTEAVRIALVQYKAGRIDLLWVAQLQTAQLSTLESVTQLRSAQRINRIRLYQALGDSYAAAEALLADPILAVRIEAANLLADQPLDTLAPADRVRLNAAFAGYVAA
jgi:outer membrane protein TolC